MASTTKARAIVAHTPAAENFTPGSNWRLQTISVPADPKHGELLVEMCASGICHSDLLTSAVPTGTPGVGYPRVVGHEGAGYVRAIGPGVTKSVSVGDPVLLSFDHCGSCESCSAGHPAYCASFMALNIPCVEEVFRSEDGREGIAGKSFGQSSFASFSVVNEKCILPAKDLVRSKEELQLFAPLGCGIQTGAGAVLNIAKPGPKDRVMVLGLGGVGLSAVMAAKTLGCAQIVGVDKVKSRIELAKELGATHGYDTTGVEDLVAGFREVSGGKGPTCVIDSEFRLFLVRKKSRTDHSQQPPTSAS